MRTLLYILGFLLASTTAVAQETIRDNHIGRVWWNSGNELIVDSHIPDASKVRVGAPQEEGQSGGGGAFSFDVTGGDFPGMYPGKRIEVVLFTGGIGRNGGGEMGLFITKPGTWGNISDAAQARIWEATAEKVEFKVPISAPNLQQGVSTIVVGTWFIQSPSGEYRTYMQDDGNLVTYRIRPGTNELCAMWSTFTGWIAPCH